MVCTSIEIPEDFLCPITHEIMRDPIVNKEGRAFERTAICDWLRASKGTCPLTRKPIKICDFVSYRMLQLKIQLWIQENDVGIAEGEIDNAEFDEKTVSPLELFCSAEAFVQSARRNNKYNRSTTIVRSSRISSADVRSSRLALFGRKAALARR